MTTLIATSLRSPLFAAGACSPIRDVNSVVDLLHYLVMAVHAQPSWFEPDGPAHRRTNLNLQLLRMTAEQRAAVLDIVRGFVDGSAMLPTARELRALIELAGCVEHLQLGLGKCWQVVRAPRYSVRYPLARAQ